MITSIPHMGHNTTQLPLFYSNSTIPSPIIKACQISKCKKKKELFSQVPKKEVHTKIFSLIFGTILIDFANDILT